MKSLCLTIVLAVWCAPCLARDGDGVGIGRFIFPHYMGSAESYDTTFLFPFAAKDYLFFTAPDGLIAEIDTRVTLPIRGDALDASEPEGYGPDHPNLARDYSYARRGMGYTPPGLFLGPRLGYKMGIASVEVAPLPGMGLGEGWRHYGWLSRASVKLAFFANRSPAFGGCVCVYIDGYWSSGRYNSTYYGVSNEHALPDRPAFNADKAGYLGVNTRLYFIKRWQSISVLAFISQQNMSNSVMIDSPLVIKVQGLSAGLGAAYLLSR